MDNTNLSLSAAAGAALATLGIFALVIAIAWYILQVVAYWRIFNKAGKPGWHSLIPLLNDWDKTDMSWNRTMAWVLLACLILSSVFTSMGTSTTPDGETVRTSIGTIGSLLGIVALILSIISEYKLAKAFGKGFGFFLGLLFLNPIFKLILGFGSAQYQGRQG